MSGTRGSRSLLPGLVLAAGCSVFSGAPAGNPREKGEAAARSPAAEAARVRAKYRDYLGLLSPAQTASFHALQDDLARDQFLAEWGVDVMLELARKLKKGMTRSQAVAALGQPHEREISWEGPANVEHWTYRRPNPAGDTVASLSFANGELRSWDVRTTR